MKAWKISLKTAQIKARLPGFKAKKTPLGSGVLVLGI